VIQRDYILRMIEEFIQAPDLRTPWKRHQKAANEKSKNGQKNRHNQGNHPHEPVLRRRAIADGRR